MSDNNLHQSREDGVREQDSDGGNSLECSLRNLDRLEGAAVAFILMALLEIPSFGVIPGTDSTPMLEKPVSVFAVFRYLDETNVLLWLTPYLLLSAAGVLLLIGWLSLRTDRVVVTETALIRRRLFWQASSPWSYVKLHTDDTTVEMTNVEFKKFPLIGTVLSPRQERPLYIRLSSWTQRSSLIHAIKARTSNSERSCN